MAFDFCVLGAGLAGISIANRLADRQFTVAVIDPYGIAGGASAVPVGMVNPANGRYASLTWRGEECYRAILSTLQEVQDSTDIEFYSKSGVIRPALDSEYADKMKTTFETTAWPKDWCFWLGKQELKTQFPELNADFGGIWMPIDLTVKIPLFLRSFAEYTAKKGVHFLTGNDYSAKPVNDKWTIHINNGKDIEADNLITAAGISSNTVRGWEYLPLTPVKGQIAILELNHPYPFDTTVYKLGYSTKYDPHHIAAGSTYEHEFETDEPTDENYNQILENLSLVIPEIREQIIEARHWSGIRASTPNRLPIIGRHPLHRNSYIFTGFGSKGLLFSAYLSQLLADFIAGNTPLPRSVDVSRLNKYYEIST